MSEQNCTQETSTYPFGTTNPKRVPSCQRVLLRSGQRRHSILQQGCQKTHTHTHIQIPCGPTLRPSKAKDFQVDFSACGRSDPSWCPASFCLGPFGGHHVSTDLSHLATYNSKSDLGFARAYQPKKASSFLERHYLNTEPIMTFRDVSCKPRFRPQHHSLLLLAFYSRSSQSSRVTHVSSTLLICSWSCVRFPFTLEEPRNKTG